MTTPGEGGGRVTHDRDALYIGGDWVASGCGRAIDVVNPATEAVLGRVPEGRAEDVDRAVAAARAAFPSWSEASVAERGKYLRAIGEGLQARMAEVGALVAQEVGTPLNLATIVQAGWPTMTFAATAELLLSFPFEEHVANSLVVREPVGVVGCLTPWNFPLHLIAAKVAPALAAGCTVVLKPSEVAPLTAFVLAEIVQGVGLPPGVFNLVTGTGPVVGEALVAHPGVDMVSFTGSTTVGRRVGELAAGTVKRVSLELGGKSATVILDDAPLEEAVVQGVGRAFLNSGQNCAALSRMLVPRSRLAEAEALAVAAAASYTPGDPMAPGSRLGPVVSEAQRGRVFASIERGIDAGATLLTGGAGPPPGLEKGFFVPPTVFSGVRTDMALAQEEIFGPVLCLLPYDTEAEAVALANDTIYGLSGAVWSGDGERAMRVARRLRTGQVEVNGGSFNLLAPFGGYKQSGNGRELGRFGLEEFFELKALHL
ncbi:MAG: aldehyde dehydrogenase family protein [Actinomycetota bacterium]|nr:aldehyde dehydrogenase family protein [Actinomycetota bacterium]